MSATTIEWTDHSINPIRARLDGRVGHYCEKVSPGCKNCYSDRLQPRFGMPRFSESRALANTVQHFLDPSKLEEVLRRKKPTKWFWCDMTDMFGAWVPFEWIAACFGVMAATPWHTHQVLTKRPERMRDWFEWIPRSPVSIGGPTVSAARGVKWHAWQWLDQILVHDPKHPLVWPLPNVWLGTSTENQESADKRVPLLLDCPAAVHFVSYEPALGSVDLRPWLRGSQTRHLCVSVSGTLRNRSYSGMLSDEHGRPLSDAEAKRELEAMRDAGVKVIKGDKSCDNFSDQTGCLGHRSPRIDWVIVGGESGPRARPCDIDWINSVVSQCREFGTPCFVKQLGRHPLVRGGDGVDAPLDRDRGSDCVIHLLHDRKGGDMAEWPEYLRVREFPKGATNA